MDNKSLLIALTAISSLFATAGFSGNSQGGNFLVANSLEIYVMEMPTELRREISTSLNGGGEFSSNGTNFKALSKFRTLDDRLGFVLESDDGIIHTLTEEDSD